MQIETLANGLTVLIEEIPHAESAAYNLFIPGGILTDEEKEIGSSLILADLTSRGAGSLDSRALSEAFDTLGAKHGESSGFDQFQYRGTLLASKLEQALELVALMVKEPTLPAQEIDNIRSVLLQDIASLADNPSQWAMQELSARYYPRPYSRSSLGSKEGLLACSVESLKRDWERRYGPQGAVLALAGKVSAAAILPQIKKLFGSWRGGNVRRPALAALPPHCAHHVQLDSAQLQIALAYPSATYTSPHYYATKLANQILSGGMFGRLFIEVREKRGLCYSVYARHSAMRDAGVMLCYAGTTPERAQETLDVMVHELRALKGTITPAELERGKSNMLSGLIIGEESTSARAAMMASDWWQMGRVRTLEEITAAVENVDASALDASLEAFPADSFALVTLGSRNLRVPAEERKKI